MRAGTPPLRSSFRRRELLQERGKSRPGLRKVCGDVEVRLGWRR